MNSNEHFLLGRMALALLAGASLAGCAIGPRPAAPIAALPAAWNGQPGPAAAWPSADWWHGFGSSELDGLIRDAQEHNADVAQAEARMQQAEALARIAGAALLPTIGLQPGAATIRSISPAGAVRRYSPLAGVVAASYEVDVWGKLHDRQRAVRASAQAARLEVDVVRLDVTAGVAEAYVQLLATQDQLVAVRVDAEQARQVAVARGTQRDQGVASGFQIASANNVAAQIEATLPLLEQRRTHLIDALAILTGRLPEAISVQERSLQALTLPEVEAGLPSELILHRPDLQQAERMLAAADADITVARKSFLPSIALTGSGGIGSTALASAISSPTAIFNLGLSILQPVFSGGRLRGNLDYANAHYVELASSYLGAIRQAFGETEDALASIQSATIEAERRAAAEDAASQMVDMARTGLAAGTTDAFSLLAARHELELAQGAMTQARLDHALAVISLYKALGGGWRSAK